MSGDWTYVLDTGAHTSRYLGPKTLRFLPVLLGHVQLVVTPWTAGLPALHCLLDFVQIHVH